MKFMDIRIIKGVWCERKNRLIRITKTNVRSWSIPTKHLSKSATQSEDEKKDEYSEGNHCSSKLKTCTNKHAVMQNKCLRTVAGADPYSSPRSRNIRQPPGSTSSASKVQSSSRGSSQVHLYLTQSNLPTSCDAGPDEKTSTTAYSRRSETRDEKSRSSSQFPEPLPTMIYNSGFFHDVLR